MLKTDVDLFKNKYRVPSSRLMHWDYSTTAWYFVTICTHNRDCLFGEIRNDEMVLSAIGAITADEWLKTEQIRSNVTLDTWVLMPNHLHGIIVIHHGEDAHNTNTPDPSPSRRDALNASGIRIYHFVSDKPAPSFPRRDALNASLLPTSPQYRPNTFGPQQNNLSSIIRGFKASSTRRIREAGYTFAWQSRFYDHIIRNEASLDRIRTYILNNPRQWTMDEHHPNRCVAV